METRFQQSPRETASMHTGELRRHFLFEAVTEEDRINLLYTHYDRMIIGGAKPVHSRLELPNPAELRARYFLERRELGIINVGGPGEIIADGEAYSLERLDCLYLGRGVNHISFASNHAAVPALFYLLSAPAHQNYPARLLKRAAANSAIMGDGKTSNLRTIYKYIHAEGIESCQLVMGLTLLEEGSVWNTMPAHTHTRRMEAYFYFDVPAAERVIHFMGEPTETRHLVVADLQGVISPPWSIHAGCGTAKYGFIWGMAGENADYTDMDPAPITSMQ